MVGGTPVSSIPTSSISCRFNHDGAGDILEVGAVSHQHHLTLDVPFHHTLMGGIQRGNDANLRGCADSTHFQNVAAPS